jgi:dipeptidyl aminopeptidase/acylaminoacyl peptidase
MQSVKGVPALVLAIGLQVFFAPCPSARAAERQPVELIPREVLFGNPVKTGPQISPDGRRLSYLAPVNDVLNVWVKTVGKDDDKAVTKDTDRGIRIYFWTQDNRHIMYLQDRGGDENWRLFAVDLDSGEARDLTPFENVQTQIVASDKQAESEQIVEAMKSKGLPYEYLVFPDEGHGFAKPENRLKSYAAAEKFLAQHLGGRYEQDKPAP